MTELLTFTHSLIKLSYRIQSLYIQQKKKERKMTTAPMQDYNDRLCFYAEWYEHELGYLKKFLMNYYPCDNTVELFERSLNQIFLKRSSCEGITQRDIYVGNTLRIYGRCITITEYADERTRLFVGRSREHTFVLLKPGVVDKLGEVLAQIESKQFQIIRMRMSNLSRKEALDFYGFRKGDPFLPFVLEHIASGPVVALELVGDRAIERWIEVAGPMDPLEARKTAPDTLRALYGQERASNGFHEATDYQSAVEAACYFFPQGSDKRPPKTTVRLDNSTCCIIKPHAIHEGKMGYIIKEINESQFYITALQMFYLSHANADEFLEVYKGVVSDFNSLLLSYLDGPCVVLEISCKNPEVKVSVEFRKFAGPPDPDIARQIRPETLRAKFGVDKYRNGVHVTDLPEDTVLELEYFFKILDL